MCWESSHAPVRKIAKKEIDVFKIGTGNYSINCVDYKRKDRGYYTHFTFIPFFATKFTYEKDKITDRINIEPIHTNTEFYLDSFYEINEGYHSFSRECVIQLDTYERLKVIGKNDKELINCHNAGICVGKFIIPKEACYYENEDGEIVSEQIIFNSIVLYCGNKKCKFSEYEKVYQ